MYNPSEYYYVRVNDDGEEIDDDDDEIEDVDDDGEEKDEEEAEVEPVKELPTMLNLTKPPFRIIVHGPSEKGKSSIVRKIALELREYFNRIYVMSNNAEGNKNYSYADKCISGNVAKFTKIVNDILDHQRAEFEAHKPLAKILLIFEDYLAVWNGGNPAIQTRLATEARNYSVSVIWVSHRIQKMPTTVRDNASLIVIVGCGQNNKGLIDCIASLSSLDNVSIKKGFYASCVMGFAMFIPAGADYYNIVKIEEKYATKK